LVALIVFLYLWLSVGQRRPQLFKHTAKSDAGGAIQVWESALKAAPRGNAFTAQLAFHGRADLVQEFFVGVALRFDGLRDLFEGFRIEMAEGQIFKLA
jgi:hypothetical protein